MNLGRCQPAPVCDIVWGPGSKGNIVVFEDMMLLLVRQFCDVTQHWDIKGTSGIIPIELNTTMQIPRPVLGKFASRLDAFDQMIDVFLS